MSTGSAWLQCGRELMAKVDSTHGRLQRAVLDSAFQVFTELMDDETCAVPIREQARFFCIRLILDYSEDYSSAQSILWKAVEMPPYSEEWIELRLLDLEIALRSGQIRRADWMIDDPVLDGLSEAQVAEFELLWHRYRKLPRERLKTLRGSFGRLLGSVVENADTNEILAQQWGRVAEGEFKVEGELRQVTKVDIGDETFELRWPEITQLEHARSVAGAISVYLNSEASDGEIETRLKQLQKTQSCRPELLFLTVLLFHYFGYYNERDDAFMQLKPVGDEAMIRYCSGLIAQDRGDIKTADAAYMAAMDDPDLESYAQFSKITLDPQVAQLIELRKSTTDKFLKVSSLLIQGLACTRINSIDAIEAITTTTTIPRELQGLRHLFTGLRHPGGMSIARRRERIHAAQTLLGEPWADVIIHARAVYDT